MKNRIPRLMSQFLFFAAMTYAGTDRIDSRLYTFVPSGERLRVLIVLTQQPQRETVGRAEAIWRAEANAARARVEAATKAPFPFYVDDARAELDRINLEIRQTAMQEIRRTIQPQQDRVALILRSYGATNIHAYTVINAISAQLPPEILPILNQDSDIATVSPLIRLRQQLSISVPAIQAPAFWSAYSGGTGESVGVLDSGIDSGNPGFSGVNIIGQVFLNEAVTDPCFDDDPTTANDLLGHGTHVAGIVASQGGGSCPACVGVAFGLHKLYALKIGWLMGTGDGCPGGGAAYPDDVIAAIDWAISNTTVNVFNFSYGDDDSFSQILDQIGDAYGVNIVIAAGNFGTGAASVESPGTAYNGLTVGSIDDQGTVDRTDDVLSSWSLPGPTAGGRFKPDISAPGNHGNGFGGIESTCNDGDYCGMEGTSMATAHVAGSLALIRSAGAPDGLAAKAILLNSAYANVNAGWMDDGGWVPVGGWGFVDLSQASTQITNCFRASAFAAQPSWYAGIVNGTVKATLVWNRHLTGTTALESSLSNLDLYAYDGSTGNVIGSSTSTIQNVEQTISSDTGTVVLAVVPVSIEGGTAEPYALAVSAAGFVVKNGPALTVSCTGPSGSVDVNATFTIPCTVTNNGDLTAFAVSGSLNWQGSPTGPVNQFGDAGPGQQSSAQSWQITAPATAGSYTLDAAATSSSYGQALRATATVTVMVGPPALSVTAAANASAGYSASSQTVTLSATVTSSGGTVNAGTVTFTVLQGTAQIGPQVTSETVSSGSASASYTLPGGTAAGSCRISAVYNAGGNFGGSSGTASLTVNPAATITTTNNVTAVCSSIREPVTVWAMVTSTAGTVNAGTVTFTVLGTPVTGTVTNGTATAVYTVPDGTYPYDYPFTAVYNSGGNFGGSWSYADLNVMCGYLTETNAANVSATYSASSQPVTLSAMVTSSHGTVNAGTVTFALQGTQVTSGTVTNGAATVVYTIPAGTVAGSYPIWAVYNIENIHSHFLGSSGTASLTVNPDPATTAANITWTAGRADGSLGP